MERVSRANNGGGLCCCLYVSRWQAKRGQRRAEGVGVPACAYTRHGGGVLGGRTVKRATTMWFGLAWATLSYTLPVPVPVPVGVRVGGVALSSVALPYLPR